MPAPLLSQRVQRRYNLDMRIKLLMANGNTHLSDKVISALEGIPRTTCLTWLSKKDAYLTSERNKRCLTLDGQGKPVAMQFANDLLAFMKAVRACSHLLTTAHMVTWIKTHQQSWVETYLQRKAASGTGYDGLLGLCQRFAHRHGFAQRVPCYSKLKRAELEEQKNAFAANFWEKHDEKPLRDIVNVDETAVYYDMPPRHTWCEIGEDAKVDSTEKHSRPCLEPAPMVRYGAVLHTADM
ncbi:hypothetical protein DYB34_013059 [Aphanomyces astaci]|uniref:DDE-1 domain-containing protein n=1 Tax=Aphanomyces astaci TaxID=112090 RepID=A0A3R6ZN39_APHAT|nr:hypothetical protein DYB34_013059 [Aphanomyces astaci]